MKNIKFYKNICCGLALAASLVLTSCGESEYVSVTANTTNTIDTNREGETTLPSKLLKVKNEDFKLEVSYSIAPPEGVSIEDFKWRVTNDKNLNIEVFTKGLPDGYHVWIDNVHIDTFIEATNPYFNGILQDLISGQDKDFIEGTFRAYSYDGTGRSDGEVVQRRYVDSDYLKKGVYSNKISLIYGLLIQGPNDPEPYGVDVPDEVHVYVYNCIERYDNVKDVINVYTFDSNGNEVYVDSYPVEKEKSLSLSQ